MVCSRLCFNTPMPLVVFAWGSISTSNTLRPAAARYVARLMAVVVFPTPPFWFAIAYTFDTGCFRTFHLTMPVQVAYIISKHIVTNAKVRSNSPYMQPNLRARRGVSLGEYKHRTRAGRDTPLFYVYTLLLPLSHKIGGKPGSVEGTPTRGHIISVGHRVGTTVKT